MAPRRSHLKSRKGCWTCKRRKVKCDESGPPCTNCKIRSTDCSYPDPEIAAKNTIRSKSSTSPSADSTCSGSLCATERRTIELQLMHRWSTVTFETMSSELAGDWEIWRTTVPEVAIKYDFLLDSLFAVTAFHLAYQNPAEAHQYISKALEYQAQAFTKFRSDLGGISADDSDAHGALVYCSMVLMVLALASSSQPLLKDTMIQNTITHYEMVKGVTVVMLKRPECIMENDLFGKIPNMMALPRQEYSSRAAKAMEMLSEMNEIQKPAETIPNEAPGSPGDDSPLPEVKTYLACKNAIWWLEYLFATCNELRLRGFALAWLSLAGDDFMRTLKEENQIALLILMWWGVFLDPLGEIYWYGEDFGKNVAFEIVTLLEQSTDPVVGELILLVDEELRSEHSDSFVDTNVEMETDDPMLVEQLKPFWEPADAETGDVGNVPASVIAYMESQSSRLFDSPQDRQRIRARVINAARSIPLGKDTEDVDGAG